MPDFGAPVADQITPPNPNQGVQTLSGLMGIAQQQQNLQLGQQQLQAGAADVQMKQQSAAQRQGIAKIDWSKYDDETGMVSTDKMLSDPSLRAATGDQFLDVLGKAAQIRTSQLTNKQSLVNLNDGLRNQFGSIVSSLRTDPDVINDTPAGRQKVTDAVNAFGAAGGPDAQRVAQIYGPQVEHVPQGQLARGLSTVQLQAMDASRQAAAQTPQYVNTGGSLSNINPQAAAGNLNGSPNIPTTLSPGEEAQRVPVFQNGQPGTVPLGSITPGAPGYSPGTPFGSGRYGSQPGNTPGFVASGASMGTPEMYGQMNDHWAKVGNDASNAQTNIGLAQNIKAYADQALTGKQGDRLAAVNGFLSIFGKDAQTDLSTATDLLNKQMARLSLTSRASSGGTDAAGALATAANPHGSMTADAIKEAADQVISTQKMALSQQKFLQPYRQANDAQGYQSALSQFNTVADPRIWQFADMNPAQRSSFKARMSAADQKEFGGKIRAAERLGVIQ